MNYGISDQLERILCGTGCLSHHLMEHHTHGTRNYELNTQKLCTKIEIFKLLLLHICTNLCVYKTYWFNLLCSHVHICLGKADYLELSNLSRTSPLGKTGSPLRNHGLHVAFHLVVGPYKIFLVSFSMLTGIITMQLGDHIFEISKVQVPCQF